MLRHDPVSGRNLARHGTAEQVCFLLLKSAHLVFGTTVIELLQPVEHLHRSLSPFGPFGSNRDARIKWRNHVFAS